MNNWQHTRHALNERPRLDRAGNRRCFRLRIRRSSENERGQRLNAPVAAVGCAYAVKPWQWLLLATALQTLVFWFKAWTVSIQLESAEKHGRKYDWRPIGFMQTLFRSRNLTTCAYLAIGLVFARRKNFTLLPPKKPRSLILFR